MRKILMLGAALVAVSSCAEDYILHGNARLEPVDDSGFRYIVGTNASSERDDPDAEAVRLRWIGEAVAGNDLCGHGYDIVGRKEVFQRRFLGVDLYDILYEGKCRT
jgi:hypothetical protein